MSEWVVFSGQPLVVGAVLVLTGGVTVLSRRARQRVDPVSRIVGVVELILGAALLLPPLWRAETVAAILLTAGSLAYLGYSHVSSPGSPVGVRRVVRAGVLLLAGVASLWATKAVLHWSFPVELAVIAMLTAEWDRYWLVPLRRLATRLRRPPSRHPDELPLHVTIAQLHRSGVYGKIARLITSADVREHRDAGQWRIVCYAARFRGEQVSAVFFVPRQRFDPGAVRAALVDETTGKTLLSFDAVSDPIAEAGWYGTSRDLAHLI